MPFKSMKLVSKALQKLIYVRFGLLKPKNDPYFHTKSHPRNKNLAYFWTRFFNFSHSVIE